MILGFVVFCFIAMAFCALVAVTILYNKKLRDLHPSLLIGLMAICEFICCWTLFIYRLGTINFSCYFGLPYAYMHMLNLWKHVPNWIYAYWNKKFLGSAKVWIPYTTEQHAI